MPYFVTVLQGPDATSAEPVMAIADPRAVRAVMGALRRAMTTAEPVPKAPLRIVGRREQRGPAGAGRG